MLDFADLNRRLDERVAFPKFLASIGRLLDGAHLPDGRWTWVSLGGYVETGDGEIVVPTDTVGFHIMEFEEKLADADAIERLIDLAGRSLDRSVLMRLAALAAAAEGVMVEDMQVWWSVGERKSTVWDEVNSASTVTHWMSKVDVRLAIGMPATATV